MELEGWKTYSLSDLIIISGGGTPKTNVPDYWNGDIPWLSVVDFNLGNKHLYSTEKSISEKGLQMSSTKILKKGQIIISARGTVGEMAVLAKDMAFNQSCYGIDANDKTNNDFLYYLLKASIQRIKKNTHGAVFDTITKNTFDNISVTIPTDLSEQSRIATILSSLDDKIELNLRMNKTLEAIAQTIFKEWFVDFRFPGFDGELVDGLPRGWRKIRLSDKADIQIGRTPPRMEHKWFSKVPSDIKWISIKDMGEAGVYINNTAEYLTYEAMDRFRIPEIPSDTVILSFKLTVGRVCITTERMLSNEAIAQIRTELGTEYIYCYLTNFDYKSLGSTSSIATAVNSKSIKELPLLLPPEVVLNHFIKTVSPLFERIKINCSEIKTLVSIRDSLLPKLMTGKIRVVL